MFIIWCSSRQNFKFLRNFIKSILIFKSKWILILIISVTNYLPNCLSEILASHNGIRSVKIILRNYSCFKSNSFCRFQVITTNHSNLKLSLFSGIFNCTFYFVSQGIFESNCCQENKIEFIFIDCLLKINSCIFNFLIPCVFTNFRIFKC